MAEHYLNIPDFDLSNLRIGDKVYLSGTVYTARDAAHKRIVELIKKKEKLPFDINGAVIYYVGPSPAKPGKPIGSAGPTTSYRMDPYTNILLDNGLKIMIGKGARSERVIESIKKNKAVYLAAVGGSAGLIAQCIISSKIIAYEDLGAEAVRMLEVKNFPCIVANDIYGGDIYKSGVSEFVKKNKDNQII